MMSNEEIDLCFDEFKNNCINYEIKCHKCRAAYFHKTNLNLEYKPIQELNSIHPCLKAIKDEKKLTKEFNRKEKKKSSDYKKGKNNYTQGMKIERKVLKDQTLTAGSGKYNGDADAFQQITPTWKIYTEHKARLAGKGITGPSRAEWLKAQSQGADIFMVTSKELGTLVTMTKEIYDNLLLEIKKCSLLI